MAPSNNDASNGSERLEWPVSNDVLTEHVFGPESPIADDPRAHKAPWSFASQLNGRARVAADEAPAPFTAERDADPIGPPTGDKATRAQQEWDVLRQKAAALKPPLPTPAIRTDGPAARKQPPAHARMMAIALGVAIALAAAEAVYIAYGQWMQTPPAPSVAASVPLVVSSDSSPTTTAQEVPAHGRLVVHSEPSGAQVLVDGLAVGVTPATLENVAPGTRRIVVRKAGTEGRQTVDVEPGGTMTVIVPLPSSPAAAFGWLAVSSAIEVDISENDALLGTSRSRQIMLQAGTHQLALANDELEFRRMVTVRIAAGKVQRLQVVTPQSVIHLNARPWAEVSIDGKSIGETPIGNVPIAIGTHDIVFRHPEHGERRVRAVVKTATPARVSVDMAQPPPVR
jgi:hypothetical protein